ncbi:glycoside hydrolase family 65 protein [Lichenifustis flavocetrariae]|uniref:Glycoside hydrolase family 65 protein n=1 Tax=Lichenifustis flavocetrariae TaxID=2949735 RepID=A0AA41Z9G2_9HYPH|nr:glycosyl hydrolase family 65 protein [Lichenifustis flavocetrariae]MCW6511757.1 glycoside hydrolase family 65 protein [Lichenifustis flavocetrariae]
MTQPKTLEQLLAPTGDPAWVLIEEGFDPLRETSVESRFAISNGFLGVRGVRATTRGTRWVAPARTYVAGLFDTPDTTYATPGLVPAADWLQIRLLVNGEPLVQHPGEVRSHRMTLDLRRGALLSESSGLTRADLNVHLKTLRLVSMSERALGLQLIEMTVEAGVVDVTVEASFEGVGLGLLSDRLDQDLGVWHTAHSGKGLAMATAAALQIDGRDVPATALGPFKLTWSWTTQPGQAVSFQRSVAIARGDVKDVDPGHEARDQLDRGQRIGWRGVLVAHEAAWSSRWQRSDVTVEGDAKAQKALRFALYHLNSAANPGDERVSIGARALTGDDYRGHVFWDTEIFLLPFYTLTWPEAARALLMYRFHTLDAARAKATGMGYRGAFYAWESADTGDEMTPTQAVGPDRKIIKILCGTQEQHISADVAYAVWYYWQATGDEAFLLDAGAEIVLETGRFWASRAQPEADGLCHIRGVIGPDEYHEHIDDNAFTNVMARWTIRRALDVAALLRKHWPDRWASLAQRLKLNEVELKQWQNVADVIATGLDPTTGLFEQFAGYFALEDIDLALYAGRSVPMDVVLGRERTQQSQVVKQADVVALLGLLPEEFAGTSGVANFRYYDQRCSHGSSLSRAMHGLAAARLGQSDVALRYFLETADIDLSDTKVAIDGGVHIAALGGIWMVAVFGFGGLTIRDDGIAIDPHLPASWLRLAFSLQWRRSHLKVRIEQARTLIEATLESGEPMTIFIGGEPYELRPGSPVRRSAEAALN